MTVFRVACYVLIAGGAAAFVWALWRLRVMNREDQT